MFLFHSHSLTEQSWLILFLFITDPGLGEAVRNPVPRRLVNGTLGQSVTLPVNIPGTELESITWDFRNLTGKNIQVCRRLLKNPAVCESELGDRFRLNLTDYSLEIQSLIKSDQGLYEVNARSGQGVHEEVVELQVYERVSSPTIQISVSSDGICNVALSCSVESGDDLIYSWWRGGGEVTADGSHSVTDGGRRLAASLSPHDSSTVYNCTVRNPVSEKTGSVDIAGPCNRTNKGSGRDEGDGTLHSAQILGIRAAIFIAAVVTTITGVYIWEQRTVKGN